MDNYKFREFLKITQKLKEIQITPLLMGSVGLEVVTERNWETQDLDIHVPGDERGWEVPAEKAVYDWDSIVEIMESLEYRLVDLHEHEFLKRGLSVEFGVIEASYKDSYRAENNNHKDIRKIEYLKAIV